MTTRSNRTGKKAPSETRQHWRTPSIVRAGVVRVFAPALDAAADFDNSVCDRFIGPPGIVPDPAGRCVGVDALALPWAALVAPGAVIFVNPPFSSFPGFVDRALEAVASGCTVVLMGPISTDTRWFRRLWRAGANVLAFHGRVNFDPPPGVGDEHGSNFPSALYVLRPRGVASFALVGHDLEVIA